MRSLGAESGHTSSAWSAITQQRDRHTVLRPFLPLSLCGYQAGGLLVLEHGRSVRGFLAGMTRFGRWACHLLCGAVMLFVIFIQYDANKAGAVPWTPLETMLYNTFARSVWGLCLLWLVVCCATDKEGIYAPWTNRLLSLPVFVPLARLTYAFYMIHLPLMAVWFFSRRDQDYYYDGKVTQAPFLQSLSLSRMRVCVMDV